MNDSQVGLNALCVQKLVALDIPPREFILEPWLRTQDVLMVHAIRGIGKTFFSLSVGLTVASGKDLLGWSAPTPRTVLYVDGEMPAIAMQERCRGFMEANHWVPEPGWFRMITPDLQDRPIPDLAEPDGQAMIEDQLYGAELLILDNISTLFRSGVENDAESWSPVQEWALKLRKAHVSTLFVHHSGKSGQQRGTSRREDILDTVINLKRPSDYVAADGCRLEVHFEKARGLAGDAVQPIEASIHSGTDDTMVWMHKPLEEASRDKIVSMLKDGMLQREISREIGKSVGWVNKVAQQARASGEIA